MGTLATGCAVTCAMEPKMCAATLEYILEDCWALKEGSSPVDVHPPPQQDWVPERRVYCSKC